MSLVWEQFVEAYQERIYRYCFHILGSRAEAEDLTQEVFLRCFERAEDLSKADSISAWVYTIARNRCIDRHRWYRRALKFFQLPSEPQVHLPESEIQLTLRKLVGSLPGQQREVFVLRHWHGFSTDEVAELLKVHPGTVKTQLKRSVDKIRRALEQSENSSTENLSQSSNRSERAV